ncbi:hypothetical protein L3X38_027983 [Prunus dulcis]|uniref:Uncharacterized protein n=1 Tax=Prunus dulcis TaxID=3755 RepID=A0AAD4VPT9_PRUDU|nr:hypothetical protein L3X38_032103 [Prunus dulcis]KAI5328586.1 hypothetical protein L3X38_027983 [Prunus dulcis]
MSTRRSLSTSLLTSLIKPDRTLSASEYSLLSIKRDASLASTRCRRKVRFSGKSEDQMCLILCLIFFMIASSFIRRASEEEDGFQECDKE